MARTVTVGDDLTLPAPVKVADGNLPARLQDAALNATIGTAVAPKADKSQANTFTQDQTFSEKAKARRMRIGEAGGTSEVGLIVSDTTSDDYFDKSRRLAYIISTREQENAGSLCLIRLTKSGPIQSVLFAAEFEAKTSRTVSGATALRLHGAQGIIRHESDTTLPLGVGLGAVVQVDSPGNAAITSARGLYVYKPERYVGGSVGTYHGVYIGGAADPIGDVGGTDLIPGAWNGLRIKKGQATGLVRAINAEGTVAITQDSGAGPIITTSVTGESWPRFELTDEGSFQFSSGAASFDSFMRRRAAKVIEFNGTVLRPGAIATASLPTAAVAGAGAIVWDTTTAQLKVSDGTTWKVATLT